jgi:hypothetical protein
VTVSVTRSLPGDLVPSGSGPATFTVSASTLVLGGSGAGGLFGGSLADVSVGDMVAGGLVGDAGQTLSQVEATPLRVLLDLPASAPATSGTPVTATNAQALNRALALLGDKSAGKTKAHKHARKAHKKSHVRKHTRKHAKRA